MSAVESRITVRIKVITEGGEAEGSAEPETIKLQKRQEDNLETVDAFKAGNVGDVQGFTDKQFGNVKGLATNPLGFFFGQFGKIAKGGGVIALALIIFAAVQFIIEELMKPGRLLDRRFKRIASREIEIFTDRLLQEELRLGLKTIIITSKPLLRGGQGLVSGNLYRQPQGILNRSYYDTRVPLPVPSARAQGLGKGKTGGGAGVARARQ